MILMRLWLFERCRALRKENAALLLKESLTAAESTRVEIINWRLASLRSTLMAYEEIGVKKEQKPKDEKRPPQIQDLPKLQEKVTIFQLLDFEVFRFHSYMENRCVPEVDRKRYLFEATPSLISGFLKVRGNRPFRELLALVPVKLLGPRWKLVILKSLKSLQQKPSEKLDAFGYQFNPLVAASGTDLCSWEAKELLPGIGPSGNYFMEVITFLIHGSLWPIWLILEQKDWTYASPQSDHLGTFGPPATFSPNSPGSLSTT